MKKIWGNLLFGLARFIDLVFGGLIGILSAAVGLVEGIRQLFLPLLTCFGFTIFSGGIFLIPFINPGFLIFIMILVLFPFLGMTFVSFLDYGRYIFTEYLYDQADYYRLGKDSKKDFSHYGPAYRRQKMREEEEARRRAQEAQNARWEEIFKEFYRQSGYGGQGYGQTGGQGYSQGGYEGYRNRQRQQGAYNPFDDFKKKYKEACDTLGIPYDTDEYQAKLAYRKLAKKYHPDINKEAGATEKFQKINQAYEFLSRENIDRYKRM